MCSIWFFGPGLYSTDMLFRFKDRQCWYLTSSSFNVSSRVSCSHGQKRVDTQTWLLEHFIPRPWVLMFYNSDCFHWGVEVRALHVHASQVLSHQTQKNISSQTLVQSPAALFRCQKLPKMSRPNFLDIFQSSCLQTALESPSICHIVC